jgi:hypothetical protein
MTINTKQLITWGSIAGAFVALISVKDMVYDMTGIPAMREEIKILQDNIDYQNIVNRELCTDKLLEKIRAEARDLRRSHGDYGRTGK